MLEAMRGLLALLAVSLAWSGCWRFPAEEVVRGPPAAQRTLEGFVQALAQWDVARVEALLFGGAAHPLWRRLRRAMEGRGIRLVEPRVGPVRRMGPDAAVGAFRYRMRGGEADPRLRAARVVLVRQGQAWRITFWGNRQAAKRHLQWVLRGANPLAEPGLSSPP
jgi:hypothetical protein